MLPCLRSIARRYVAAETSLIILSKKMTSHCYTHSRFTAGNISRQLLVLRNYATTVKAHDDLLDVAADKIRLDGEQNLTESDVYSILRALMHSPDDPRIDWFLPIITNFIQRHSTTLTRIHLTYLRTLLHAPHHLPLLVRSLCDFLQIPSDPSKPFLDILWDIVKHRASDLQPNDKLRILDMVLFRLDRFRQCDDSPTARHVPLNSHTWNLADALGIAVFPSYTSFHPPKIKQWAAEQARLAFSPDLPWETRWENLLLLAIYRAPHGVKRRMGYENRHQPTRPNTRHHQREEKEQTTESLIPDTRGKESKKVYAGPTTASSPDWRPVLVLAALERSFNSGSSGSGGGGNQATPKITPIPSESREPVRAIVRSLWRAWKKSTNSRNPSTISRAIVAAFLRAAARVGDRDLAEACLGFCIQRGLVARLNGDVSGQVEKQVTDIYVPYLLALAVSQGTTWKNVLDMSLFKPTLTSTSVTPVHLHHLLDTNTNQSPLALAEHLVNMLLLHFTSSRDAEAAHSAYTYATQRRIPLSPRSIRDLGFTLATPEYWHLAIPLLELYRNPSPTSTNTSHPHLLLPHPTREQLLESLLLPILRLIQQERYESIEPHHAQVIGDVLWDLYKGRVPEEKKGYKYPVRFVFCVLIASGCPGRAVDIVEAIHKRSCSASVSLSSSSSLPLSPPPSTTPIAAATAAPFFTTRLFLRMMRTLVRYRHFSLTRRVFDLVPDEPVRAKEDFRRKLVLYLSRAGEHRAAREVDGCGSGRREGGEDEVKVKKKNKGIQVKNARRTARELLIRAVQFKSRHPPPRTRVPVLPMLFTTTTNHHHRQRRRRWGCLRRNGTCIRCGDGNGTTKDDASRRPACVPTPSPTTIRYAALLLTRAHRMYTAFKLLRRFSSRNGGGGEGPVLLLSLDDKTKTDIGNMMLHACIERMGWRNGRVVRRVMRLKQALEADPKEGDEWEVHGVGKQREGDEKRIGGVGFKPDRITVNILVKAVLRWKAVESGEVRGMFDHLVRRGYPASEKWIVDGRPPTVAAAVVVSSETRTGKNGIRLGMGLDDSTTKDVKVPFGTVSSSFPVPVLQQPLSFFRHVRPLYKMFIRAFYVRGDVVAARTVSGILKEEEMMAVRRREERNKARRVGLVKKKKKEKLQRMMGLRQKEERIELIATK